MPASCLTVYVDDDPVGPFSDLSIPEALAEIRLSFSGIQMMSIIKRHRAFGDLKDI
jgi:hypothetical protein